MRQVTLVGAMAALFLGVVAFYGSQAIAGQYDDCYTPATACTGTCKVGSCVAIATSLAPLSCNKGDPNGFRPAGACGECVRLKVVPSGETCGQPLSGEPCF